MDIHTYITDGRRDVQMNKRTNPSSIVRKNYVTKFSGYSAGYLVLAIS